MDIVKDEKGNIKLVNITTPVGVVPESANYWWEKIEETNGEIHDYLCVDVLIWKRQEAYSKIKENGITDESMEIQILDGEEIDGYYHIKSFVFLAFCLLESAEPCYESACVQLFSEDKFNKQRDEMMQDFKKYFLNANSQKEIYINTDNFVSELSKGGDTMDKKLKLLSEYGLSESELDFKLEDFEIDVLKEKFENLKNKTKTDDDDDKSQNTNTEENNENQNTDDNNDADDNTENDNEDDTENYSLNLEQLKEQVLNSLRTQTYTDPDWGECCKYYYIDIDFENSEVFAYDSTDWSIWGFRFEMNGDNVEIDFDNKKRKKFAIVDFDEGTSTANYAYAFNNIKSVCQTKCSSLSDKVNELTTQLNKIQSEEFEFAVSKIFETFSNLEGIEAFEDLKNNHTGMDVDVIEEKCYAIEGRINKNKDSVSKFANKKTSPIRINIETNRADREPYGDLFIKYGNKN